MSERQNEYMARRMADRPLSERPEPGSRKALLAKARELVATAGAEVQRAIAGDPEFIRDFCQMLKDGSKARDRTCVNAVLTILKLQGQERVLLVEYVRQLGASSEEEARKAVEAYRSAGGADLETAIERCTAFLEGALPMHEQHRGMVVRRLGGYLPIDMPGERA